MSDRGNDGYERPEMMGDETEEQSLNQQGKKGARITEDEVNEAFRNGGRTEDEDGEIDEEQDDARLGSNPAFWKGFALGMAATFAAVCLIRPRQYWY